MIEGGGHPGQTVLVLGVLTVAAMPAKAGMGRVGLPSLIAFLRRWPQAAPNDTGSFARATSAPSGQPPAGRLP